MTTSDNKTAAQANEEPFRIEIEILPHALPGEVAGQMFTALSIFDKLAVMTARELHAIVRRGDEFNEVLITEPLTNTVLAKAKAPYPRQIYETFAKTE